MPVYSSFNQRIGFRSNIIDFGFTSRGSSTIVQTVSPFDMLILCKTNPYLIFKCYGTSSGTSTGNLQFIYDDISLTKGHVVAFNDGVINVPQLNINRQLPLVEACKQILANAGSTARPYKLDVMRDGEILFTLRSVIWGTVMITDLDPAYQLIDRQDQEVVDFKG